MKKDSYSLKEISEWPGTGQVILPNVQRGFVWKPWQIEDLWDSLMRKYPVGVFILSPTKNDRQKFEMLDGQQRATAICLGFGTQLFRQMKADDLARVFIDLDYPSENDRWLYLFRVITKWHPWGYQKQDNSKPLESASIHRALRSYKVGDHLITPLDHFFPYDSLLPIPFEFFIQAENYASLVELIKGWKWWEKLKEDWLKKAKRNSAEIRRDPQRKGQKVLLSTEVAIFNRIKEIFERTQELITEEKGFRIPVSYFNFEELKNRKSSVRSNIKKLDNPESLELHDVTFEENDELENLFVRLNASGTPLRGEELNYSMLKAHITPDLIQLIENNSRPLFKPARFITIIYRLYQHDPNNSNGIQHDSLSMKIKPRQFQKTVNSKSALKNFEEYVADLIAPTNGSSNVLNYCRSLLEYKKDENDYGLPYFIITRIAETAPELMFVILYRLKISKDRIDLNSKEHRRMLGIITLCYWLGKGGKLRDYSKLLSNIWPCLHTLNQELFWSPTTIQRAMLGNVLIPFPNNDQKDNKESLWLIKILGSGTRNDIITRLEKETNYGLFFTTTLFNKELILYSQRNFLSNIFKNIEFDAEDTDRPFDWDHIAPESFIEKQKGINKSLKKIYGSIGNFRAWPFGLNRMDKDSPPYDKFLPSLKLISSKEQNEKSGLSTFNLFLEKHSALIEENKSELHPFLKWSTCEPEWQNLKSREIIKTNNWTQYYKAIINRCYNLIDHWYKDHLIEELIPSGKANFNQIFDSRKWKILSEKDELDDVFNLETSTNYLSKNPIMVKGQELYFYFIYSIDPDRILENNGIEFGLWEKINKRFIKELKIPEAKKSKYQTDQKNYIQSYFTIISFELTSYSRLFLEISDWIATFPDKEISSRVNDFKESIKKESMIFKQQNKLH